MRNFGIPKASVRQLARGRLRPRSRLGAARRQAGRWTNPGNPRNFSPSAAAVRLPWQSTRRAHIFAGQAQPAGFRPWYPRRMAPRQPCTALRSENCARLEKAWEWALGKKQGWRAASRRKKGLRHWRCFALAEPP